jgi:hypothetical protein
MTEKAMGMSPEEEKHWIYIYGEALRAPTVGVPFLAEWAIGVADTAVRALRERRSSGEALKDKPYYYLREVRKGERQEAFDWADAWLQTQHRVVSSTDRAQYAELMANLRNRTLISSRIGALNPLGASGLVQEREDLTDSGVLGEPEGTSEGR